MQTADVNTQVLRELANLSKNQTQLCKKLLLLCEIQPVPKFMQQGKKKKEEQLFLQIIYFSPMGNPAPPHSMPPIFSTSAEHTVCSLLSALPGSHLRDSPMLQPKNTKLHLPVLRFPPAHISRGHGKLTAAFCDDLDSFCCYLHHLSSHPAGGPGLAFHFLEN